MQVLVPIDGSDCSDRALRFACEFADRYDADLHVVHFSDGRTSATEQVVEHARKILDDAGIEDDPEVVVETDVGVRTAGRVGKAIVSLVSERGYDHVVMGHHGSGTAERAILGSAAETVVRAETTPVTIVP
jgi:nucleotide-binding universal stress UspA family protein